MSLQLLLGKSDLSPLPYILILRLLFLLLTNKIFTFFFLQAFLTKVAKIQQGALELLRSGVIVKLAQFQVYDMRPEIDQQG